MGRRHREPDNDKKGTFPKIWNRVPVRDTHSGIFYRSISDAAQDTGLSATEISKSVRNIPCSLSWGRFRRAAEPRL